MNFKEHISSFSSLNVLVIGDVMLDTYRYGEVNRISPEAPVPVLLVNSVKQHLGGAANVALNCKSLGANVYLCGFIGNDWQGAEIKKQLKDEKINDHLFEDILRPTTSKTRLMSGSQQMMRYDNESEALPEESSKFKYINSIKEILEKKTIQVIIFEDYDKGALSEDIIQEILRIANEKKIFTAVDPKKRNFLSYRGTSLFKPNLKEVKEGLGINIDPNNINSLNEASLSLQEKLEAENILITLSKDGVYYANNSKSGIHPAFMRNISDVSGAGDTVISVTALSMAVKKDLIMAALLSNLAGGFVCEKQGVVSISAKELIAETVSHLTKKSIL